MFDFDNIISREGTHAEKYTALKRLYGRDDLLPFWVADLEFAVAPAIREAMADRLSHPVLGYTSIPESLLESICSWNARRYGLELHQDEITIVPGVMAGVSAAVQALSGPGDAVVVQTPLYPPLMKTVSGNNRKLVENQLVLHNDRYVMDLDDLETLFQEYRPRIMVLCSPHNPVGRVWRVDELKQLISLTRQYNVSLVSDEIHADIVFPSHKHVAAMSVTGKEAPGIIVLNSASKSFNVAGLNTAYAAIRDRNLRTDFRRELRRMNLYGANIFGMVALQAAYTKAEQWLDAMLAYLLANRQVMTETLNAELPGLQHFIPEGSYLYWLNFNSLGLSGDQIRQRLIDSARVGLNDGLTFSSHHEGYWRFNFGVPRAMLEQGMARIVQAFR